MGGTTARKARSGVSAGSRDLQSILKVRFDASEFALTQSHELLEICDNGGGRLLVLGQALANRDERQVERARPARLGVAFLLQRREQIFRLVPVGADHMDEVFTRIAL